MLNFRNFDVLSFDCYGTLIDWESGIVRALDVLRVKHGVDASDEDLLRSYSRAEAHVQRGPYRPYREVLRDTTRKIARHYGVKSVDDNLLAASLPNWEPFPDTVPALEALSHRYKLGIISNIDDDLFADTARKLQAPFDWVTTAQQAGAYKPAQRIFRHALRQMDVPMQKVLHIAQSKYHDVGPARDLGWTSVWVARRRRIPESATMNFEADPNLTVPDLGALVRRIEEQLQGWDA